ncbi:hypothetical protein M885DRAFT_611524 [Pelagophyceae sp. CCMP2097]|nr:hypothetical protein M885DRAFT_611524 [Pelagophyceae sp. CCMP2097]
MRLVVAAALLASAQGLDFLKGLRQLPREATRAVRGHQLRQVAALKNGVQPTALSPETVQKMEAIGFEWQSEAQTWKHVGVEWQLDKVAARDSSRVPEAFDEESVYSAMEGMFLDDEDESRYQVVKKRRFKQKFVDEATSVGAATSLVSQTCLQLDVKTEELNRLGFFFDDKLGRWMRGAARQSARTVKIALPGGQRSMTVRATTEVDLTACHRFEYALSRAMLDEPENVADGIFRFARDDTFPLVYAVAQLKLFEEWRSYDALGSAGFAGDDGSHLARAGAAAVHDPQLMLAAAAFTALHMGLASLWRRSSGAVTLDGFEKSIADSFVGNKTSAPYSWEWREGEAGLSWRTAAAALSLLAAVPRIQMVHGYVQPKLELLALQTASLDATLDGTAAPLAAVTAIAAIAAATAAFERAGLRWARAPRSEADELEAISSALAENALSARLAAGAILAQKANSKKTAGFFTAKTAQLHADRMAQSEAAYAKVATAWCDAFHDGRTAPAGVKAENFATSHTTLAGGRAAVAAVAYALSGSVAAPLLLHAAAAATDLAPAPKVPPKAAAFDFDAE